MSSINNKTEKIISDISFNMDLDQTIRMDEIKKAWSGLGTELSLHARPVSFKNSRLNIAVNETTWHKQLVKLKNEIQTKLNRYFNKPIIKDIIFFNE
ncbi:DUF721 domain-containing protein [Candidatus Desantisbacteria bacterium]|nr:DUF721 domain-containing protein [Candidatus Desantisbacteria bacterium]